MSRSSVGESECSAVSEMRPHGHELNLVCLADLRDDARFHIAGIGVELFAQFNFLFDGGNHAVHGQYAAFAVAAALPNMVRFIDNIPCHNHIADAALERKRSAEAGEDEPPRLLFLNDIFDNDASPFDADAGEEDRHAGAAFAERAGFALQGEADDYVSCHSSILKESPRRAFTPSAAEAS